MKKLGVIAMVLLILTGCGSQKKAVYEEKVKLYKSYWSAILDQPKYKKSSSYFSIDATIEALAATENSDATHKYDVIVSNARIAMYEVEVLVVEGEEPYSDEKMMPSVGIFDETLYHLIPNQSRPDKAYQSGFKLSGEYASEDIKLHVIVTWKNYARSETFKEYFELVPKLVEAE